MTEKKVKLTDVAIRTSIKCEPEINHQVRWVGADHLDEGDFTVRRWSTTDDPLFPPTFKFAVQPGSVLIHSRNPKKVATLDFEAITGEKFFCLISKDSKILLSSYLAFQLQSDRFSEYVEHHFTGSVNKFLNWSALAAYEFVLPTIKEQQRIVELLSGVDAHAEALRNQLNVAQETRKSVLHHLLTAGGDDWAETTLGEVAVLTIGKTPSRSNMEFWSESAGVPFCTIAEMRDEVITPEKEFVTQHAINNGSAKVVRAGTLLMSFKLTIGRLGIAGVDLCPNEAIVAIENYETKVSRDFLKIALENSDLQEGTGRAVKGYTLNSKSLNQIKMLLPPLGEQQRIVDEISKIDAVIQETTSALAATRQLRNALLNKEIS